MARSGRSKRSGQFVKLLTAPARHVRAAVARRSPRTRRPAGTWIWKGLYDVSVGILRIHTFLDRIF